MKEIASQSFFYNYIYFVNTNNGDNVIENYEIKNINGEEILFLYFNFNYEFSSFNKMKNKSIKENIKDYLKKNKINYKGTIISIVVGGVLIGNLVLNKPVVNNKFDFYKPSIIDVDKLLYVPEINIIEEKVINEEDNLINNNINNSNDKIENNNKQNNISSNSSTNKNIKFNEKIETSAVEENVEVETNTYVKLKRKNGNVETIELEEYVIGVVGAEMPALFHKEALKSQAVIARTYALKSLSTGKILTDTESTQSYKSKSELEILWGSNFNIYYNKIKECVNETKGMYLIYNGNYIDAVYHSTSNGKTETSTNLWGNYYPYLVSVESPYDNLNPSFFHYVNFTYQELSNKLGMEITNETNFNIINLTEGNRVANILINDKNYKGYELRSILGLRSADFTIEKNELGVKITTKGYGHGVGLSQYGANGMAKNNYSYIDILKHYYRGVTLKKLY